MSNHYHTVIRINQDQAVEWSDREVAKRWLQIFTGPILMRRHLAGTDLTSLELEQVAELLATWRKRLCDISWFMRCINEPIARMANAEDHCTGRFWEGRFTSQALLDERAVLACMTYVDLNPIRAKEERRHPRFIVRKKTPTLHQLSYSLQSNMTLLTLALPV